MKELVFEELTCEDDIDEYIDTLVPNKENALKLIKLSESFDLLSIYSAIFTDYLNYITRDELEKLIRKYVYTFDQEMLPLKVFFDQEIIDMIDL